MDDSSNIVHDLLKEYYFKEKGYKEYSFSREVFIFYSFQDLGLAFGWNNLLSQLKSEITSKSNIKKVVV